MAIREVRLSEKQWQGFVVDYARVMGWKAYHHSDSRKAVKRGGELIMVGDADAKGLLDWMMVRPPRVLFVELKREDGKMTPEQTECFAKLSRCPGVEVYLWKPSDRTEVQRVLGR
jgi:hypothetical protein